MSSPESVVSVKSGAGEPSSAGNASSIRRAVGIVRVSRKGDREGERFTSPDDQKERIHAACEREGLRLDDTLEEVNVSGGAPLANRPGLLRAVELVESGQTDVVVVAYFDRLFRSLEVQAQAIGRVEDAGGRMLTADGGEINTDTASGWLDATFKGMVAEHQRRVTAERTSFAKRRAVARGVPPFPNVPPGYRRLKDGRLEPHPDEAPVVAEAFRLRADGATVREVREYLRSSGIDRSYHGTQALLGSRIVLGELRFGELVNESAHEAIIDPGTWRRVQRQVVSRGRRPKSERLLARLGVLCCGTCGARMVTGTTAQGRRRKVYAFYRCNPTSDCPRRVTISADVAEQTVVDAVKRILAGVEGTATADDGLEVAREEAERTEKELEAAVLAFSALDDVRVAQERLAALREARDAARDRLDDLEATLAPAVTVTADDWEILTLEERRDLVRAVIDRAVVAPGHGGERITIEPRS